MGVCYNANYGLGYYVDLPDDAVLHEEFDDGVDEYLWGVKKPKEIKHCSVGDNYTGDIDCVLVWRDNINENSDLREIKRVLDKFIDEHRLSVESDFGLVGGIYVC